MRRYIILAMLLLAACNEQTAVPVNIANPFIGGTEGLSISFQDLPPEVFDGGTSPFDVVIRLENKGEALVSKENTRIRLSGINPLEFSKTTEQLSSSAPDDLIEVRKDAQGNRIQPPLVFAEFTNFNYKSKLAGASNQFIIRADACYQYKTRSVSKLCVRENILNPKPGGICEINGDKPSFSSSAPVQIGAFKESTRAKDKIGFTFEVINIGRGSVFGKNTVCDSNRQNENKVYLTITTSLPGLQCTGLESNPTGAQGPVTLYGGSKIVSCTQPVSTSSDFEQIVTIEAVYDYEESTQTSLTVKNSGE